MKRLIFVMMCFIFLFVKESYSQSFSTSSKLNSSPTSNYFGQPHFTTGSSVSFNLSIEESGTDDFGKINKTFDLVAPINYAFDCSTVPTFSATVSGEVSAVATTANVIVNTLTITFEYTAATTPKKDRITIEGLKLVRVSNHTTGGDADQIQLNYGTSTEILSIPKIGTYVNYSSNISGLQIIPFGDSVGFSVTLEESENYGFGRTISNLGDKIELIAPENMVLSGGGSITINNLSDLSLPSSWLLLPANQKLDIPFSSDPPIDTKDEFTINNIYIKYDPNNAVNTNSNTDGTLKVNYIHPLSGSTIIPTNSSLSFAHNTPQITNFSTDVSKIYCEHGSDITFDITIKEPNAGSGSHYNTYDKICLVDQNNQVIDFLSASKVNSFIRSQESTVTFTTDKLTRKHTSVKALLINNNPAGAQTMSLS